MTTTEHAAAIRRNLKRNRGWSGRQVSIRAESITISVKDPAVPLADVKAAAQGAESIARDELTGEILSGGNRYVHVAYSREAMQILGRRYADAVQRAVDKHSSQDIGNLVPIDTTPFLVGVPHPGRLSLWERDHGYVTDAYTIDGLAETIGALMIARGAA